MRLHLGISWAVSSPRALLRTDLWFYLNSTSKPPDPEPTVTGPPTPGWPCQQLMDQLMVCRVEKVDCDFELGY